MTLNEYCRKWRTEQGLTMSAIEGSDRIANIAAYESNRSSNYKHFLKYVAKAVELGNHPEFFKELIEHVEGVYNG